MCDEENRLGETRSNAQQPLLQHAAGEGVEGAERFIEEQDVVAGQEGTQQRGALPHAAGERAGPVVFEAVESEEGQQLTRFFAGGVAAASGQLHSEDDVFEHSAPGQQGIALGHVAKTPLPVGRVRQGLPLQDYLAAVRLFEAGQQAQ